MQKKFCIFKEQSEQEAAQKTNEKIINISLIFVELL